MLITVVDRMAHMGARCVRVVAGAGWGKSAFTRIYASVAPNATGIVDCRGMRTRADFEFAVGEALRAVGIDITAGPLAAWAAPGPSSTIILDGLSLILNIEHAVDTLRTLLRTLPPERNLVLCSRLELPIVWSTYFAPHEMTALGAADLAIDRDELELLFAGVERAPGTDERILSISQGWPIAVLLFVRLASNGRLEPALDELRDASTFGDLHAYVQAEIFEMLGEGELETLCAVVALGGGTVEDISLAVGRDAAPQLDQLSGRLRYLLNRKRDIFLPEPLARAAAETMQRTRIRALTRDAVGAFQAAGQYVRAAELALQLGDEATACAMLDEAATPVAHFLPGSAYLRVALGVRFDHLARSRNVLTILLAGHVPPNVRWELAEKVDARWQELDARDGDVRLRTVLRVARAYLLRLSSKFDAARQSARGAERDIGLFDPELPIVRALHVICATLAFNYGDIEDGNAAWERSGESMRAGETFFSNERIEGDIYTALASADSNVIAHTHLAALDETASWHDELGAMLGQICAAGLRYYTTGQFPDAARTDGDNEQLRFDPASLPAHAAAAQSGQFERAIRFTALAMIGAALAQSESDVAADLLNTATGLADRMSVPLPRVLSRVVAAAVHDGAERVRLLDEAADIATGPLRARVDELRSDVLDETSIFRPFLHGPAQWSKAEAGPACRIEIMQGHVICRGAEVRLRGRELELLVALALSGGALSREALTARLWPDQDDAASAGSLRSTLHRLRAQLRDTQVVMRDGNQYRLAPGVSVDVHEAEALYNVLRREASAISDFERGRLERQFAALAYGIPDAYARWAWFTAVETRLVDLRHGIGMLLAREDFRTGAYASAMRWTEQLTALDPLDEVAAELLFQSIVYSGGRSEAARWLRRYRDLLAREYGMEPSFELDRAANEDDLSASA